MRHSFQFIRYFYLLNFIHTPTKYKIFVSLKTVIEISVPENLIILWEGNDRVRFKLHLIVKCSSPT